MRPKYKFTYKDTFQLDDPDVTKTSEIILYLIDLIKTKKVPVNKIMPSEHALMERFKCSRSVIVTAYQKLRTIGAVYSIKKRGHFVSENFHNLIKPVSYLIKADRQMGHEVFDFVEPEWFADKNIIFTDGARFFQKKIYKKNKVIGEAEVWLSAKWLGKNEPIDLTVPLIDTINNKKKVENVVYHLEYEKDVNRLGHQNMMVLTMFGYDDEAICIAGKYYIDPEHLKFYHQEISLL